MKRSAAVAVWPLLILVILVDGNSRAAEAEDPCPPAEQCWTTQDVIDGHIDHHAQSVMMGMMERGGEEAVDASSMLCAVKRGELEGIYLPNQQVPALRARGVGSNWWEMIPQGKHSACYKLPAERPPMIVFREQVQDLRPELAVALREAWLECGSVSVARCYTLTLTRPSDPSMEDGVWLEKGDFEPNPIDGLKCLQVWSCEPAAVFAADIPRTQGVPDVVVVEKTEDQITEGLCIPNPLGGPCSCLASEPEVPCKFRWGDSQVPETAVD